MDKRSRIGRTEEQTGRDQFFRLPRLSHQRDWQKPHNLDQLNTREWRGKVISIIIDWTSSTYEPHYWLGLCAMPYLQHKLLSTTDSGELVYLPKTNPQQVSTTTGTIQTTNSRHQHYKRSEQNDLTLPMDRNRPITTNIRHLGLTANNVRAKLTNKFIRTELRTFDWQQLFT